ncbi:uncharacterized protein [Watersipora subatra]|uniref:uncharacterized protein n=1 Tax=Watersipora subatra TaxID=2589382 RepID=UPI00355C594E
MPIAHLNIRGLVRKVDELKYHVVKHSLKIIHISEAFLKPNLSSNLLYIPNFSTIRRDRAVKHGGGVLTYIHSTLNHTVLTNLDDILPESLTTEISQPSAKPFITSVVYRPPNSPASWLHQFALYFTKCKEICDKIIILGDFNIDLNTSNEKWTNLINQIGLLQLIQSPTKIQAHSKSLIDHIYETNPSNIHHHGIMDIGLSGHNMVYARRKLRVASQTTKRRTKITYYDWKNLSTQSFQRDINFASWREVYEANSSELMLDKINTKLQSIVDSHLKLKTRYVKSKVLPVWLDHEVQQSIQRWNFLKKAQRWAEYKHQRNFLTNLEQKKKKQYVDNLVSQSDTKQTKHLWNVLCNTQLSSTIPNIPQSLTDPCTSSLTKVANSLNHHFVNIAQSTKIHSS